VKNWFPIGVPLPVTGRFLKKLQDFFSVQWLNKSVGLTNFHPVNARHEIGNLSLKRWTVFAGRNLFIFSCQTQPDENQLLLTFRTLIGNICIP
jgi:hypothetical protein